MKSLVMAAAAALTLAAGTAQAVTVAATIEASPGTSILVDGSAMIAGQNINGRQVTFDWDGSAPFSAAFTFTLPGAAKITFDNYDDGGTNQQSAFVLYQTGGGPQLTTQLNAGSGYVPLVSGQDGLYVGNTTGVLATTFPSSSTPVYDAIDGSDPFVPGSGNEWVLGFWDSALPTDGSMSFTITAVPLPASAWFLLAGVGALAWRSRRKAA
ncbi:MAG: VPLPA-CTERM sorting domain-containing protein [Paracoccaceae bacterium]|nr:VPLPA-CTERM sorting domain-containing protein [Paracoccaceae bacterium]